MTGVMTLSSWLPEILPHLREKNKKSGVLFRKTTVLSFSLYFQ